jgi:type VI secretion system protein ImpH
MPEGSAPELTAAERSRRIEAARRAGFYPLMLLLERLLGERAHVGTAAAPGEESIRFRHDPRLEFSASDVSAVREGLAPPDPEDFAAERAAVVEVTTTFLGLSGAVSPLPQYLPEEVAQEDPDAPRLREFLDLFHPRGW